MIKKIFYSTVVTLSFLATTAYAGENSYCASFANADAIKKAKAEGFALADLPIGGQVVGSIDEGSVYRVELNYLTETGEVADTTLKYLVVSKPSDGECLAGFNVFRLK